MWNVNGYSLQMCEGDFGMNLPVTVNGAQIADGDSVKLTIKSTASGETIVEKTFSNIAENTFFFVLTEAETALLPLGQYVFVVDWYHDGEFMCNLIPCSVFKVVDKA